MKKPTPFPLTSEETARFWAKVDCSGGAGACWNWQAGVSGGGYGLFSVTRNGKREKHSAHRIAFTVSHGISIGEESCCHSCDNRLCCNPDHLWLGTHAENMADRNRKGRARGGTTGPKSWTYRGVANHKSKLNPDKVRAIRHQYKRGEVGYRTIAEAYGVTPTAIKAIVTRKSWKEVE